MLMNHHIELANAIETGDETTVSRVLETRPELVNCREWTPPPLHCSVLWNQPRIGELLLDLGADIEMRDPDRQTTPLRYAIVYARIDVIPMLLERGASTRALVEGGSSCFELAVNAANGSFKDYDDTPPPDEYAKVVKLLRKLGVS